AVHGDAAGVAEGDAAVAAAGPGDTAGGGHRAARLAAVGVVGGTAGCRRRGRGSRRLPALLGGLELGLAEGLLLEDLAGQLGVTLAERDRTGDLRIDAGLDLGGERLLLVACLLDRVESLLDLGPLALGPGGGGGRGTLLGLE